MEDKKNRKNPFLKIFIILFFIFVCLYISLQSGYYPSRLTTKTILTNEKKIAFENDLKKGKPIPQNGYLEKEVNYSNFVTKTGNFLTKNLSKIIINGANGVKSIAKYLFW